MSKKQPKIKRYSRSMGKGRHSRTLLKKIVGLVLSLALLLGVGYFAAPYAMDGIGRLWHSLVPPPDTTPIVKDEPSADSTPVEAPLPTPTPLLSKNIIYSEVHCEELTTREKIVQTAQKLKAKGVTTAVLTLKNPEGKLFYASETAIGKESAAKTIIDLALVAEIFKENDIQSCANLYTFMDKTAPNLDRSTAVKYVGTDYTWLDSAKELGGKPWANPASATMQQYIYDITNEILSAGFKEIIYSAVQLPTGHSLDKRDFSATSDQLLAQLKGFISSVQTRVSSFGARASFAFDFASVTGGDYKKYIDVPNRLGVENMILTCALADIGATDLSELATRMKTSDNVELLSIWLSDTDFPAPPIGLSGYFVKI